MAEYLYKKYRTLATMPLIANLRHFYQTLKPSTKQDIKGLARAYSVIPYMWLVYWIHGGKLI